MAIERPREHRPLERKLTSPGTIKGHEVAASQDNPEFPVRSDKPGKIAAHKLPV
jgi:hypothetical protein